jgi:hypothetical protein
MILISGLGCLLEWERLSLYDRYGYVGMTKFLMKKIILSCRLSTNVPVFSVYGHLFSGWRTRSIYGGLYTVESYG